MNSSVVFLDVQLRLVKGVEKSAIVRNLNPGVVVPQFFHDFGFRQIFVTLPDWDCPWGPKVRAEATETLKGLKTADLFKLSRDFPVVKVGEGCKPANFEVQSRCLFDGKFIPLNQVLTEFKQRGVQEIAIIASQKGGELSPGGSICILDNLPSQVGIRTQLVAHSEK